MLPPDEREAVQKKTFTKWVNSILSRVGCRISDLYLDLRDGRMLIKLLEVLSGERLVRCSLVKPYITFFYSFLPCGHSCLYNFPFPSFAFLSVFSQNPLRVECVSTVWRMWTRPCSSSRSKGSTWKTWAPMTLWMATIASSSASSGPLSFASR